MTEEEYTSALNYLFGQLIDIGINDIVTEINNQINRGKTVTIKDTTDLKAKNIKQSEVGKTQTLPMTSKEAFEISLDYLSKIIIEVPSYGKIIGETFGTNVIWEYDQTQSIKSFTTSESFSLNNLTFVNSDFEKAKEQIENIKNIIKD